MPLPSETIALPIVKGLDITTDARLLQAPGLLEAENTQFAGGGAKKRRGHAALRVRREDKIFLPEDQSDILPEGDKDALYFTSANPNVGVLCGVTSRDAESVLWDGERLYSYTPSQLDSQAPFVSEVEGQAVMPSLRAEKIAKFNEHQGQPEMADNGLTKMVVWVNDEVHYAMYDSVSDALITRGTFNTTTPTYARVFTMGHWTHTMVLDGDDDLAKLFSISSQTPNQVVQRSFGPTNHFDIWKVTEAETIFARTNYEGIDVTWITANGSGSDTRTPFHHATTNPATLISVSFSPAEEYGVAWYEPSVPRISVAMFGDVGDLFFEDDITANVAGTLRLTLSSKKVLTSLATVPFDLYWDNGTNLRSVRFWCEASALAFGTPIVRYRQRILSRAWRVGDRTFLWAGHPSTLQATWFLLDEGLLPVGHMDFGVAAVVSETSGWVGSINFVGEGAPTGALLVGGAQQQGGIIDLEAGDSTDPYDHFTFHSALSYKLRVTPNDSAAATAGIYTEPSVKGVYLDFRPPLRAAQAGRCTYIAGAQLWSYDGREVVEAGFHTGPEVTPTQVASGALTALGTYSYRVDLCHRNAQNEEVRSLSLLTNSVELTGSNQTISLAIPTVLTRRADSYFLIYRNAMEDGLPLVSWWLLNSRDPEDPSYLPNVLTTDTLTVVDDGTIDDVEIQVRELHPATDTYLQPIAAPACEIITSGRDRLWVGGGELSVGVVAPSRLFDPGEVPSFNAYLAIQVDRTPEPLTAIGFAGEVACFFRGTSIHILDSDGPDNVANGLWNPPRLALSDLGAVSQESIARLSNGLIFQSPAGFRLLGPGGSLSPVGIDIDRQVGDFEVVGSLVVDVDQEVRFYGAAGQGTWCFNYLYGTWAHWSCDGVGVARSTDGYALLARSDGYLWIETPGVWRDGPATYTHRIRTSWLHGGSLGDFQRIRLIGGLGRYADLDNPAHTLRLELFYDEREFWEERVEWPQPDSTTNSDTWGTSTWGAGVWGDNSATISNLEDLAWEWERKPNRQKCSVFSIALEDVNTAGPGFELSAFTLELARKPNLNRTPERTGTGTTR